MKQTPQTRSICQVNTAHQVPIKEHGDKTFPSNVSGTKLNKLQSSQVLRQDCTSEHSLEDTDSSKNTSSLTAVLKNVYGSFCSSLHVLILPVWQMSLRKHRQKLLFSGYHYCCAEQMLNYPTLIQEYCLPPESWNLG